MKLEDAVNLHSLTSEGKQLSAVWSDEARDAAKEARRAGAKGPGTIKPGFGHAEFLKSLHDEHKAVASKLLPALSYKLLDQAQLSGKAGLGPEHDAVVSHILGKLEKAGGVDKYTTNAQYAPESKADENGMVHKYGLPTMRTRTPKYNTGY